MNITRLHPILLIIIIILMSLVRYWGERSISNGFRRLGVKRNGVQVFAKSVLLILFNTVVLALLGLFDWQMFSFEKLQTGYVVLAIGLGLALLVSVLSFLAVKAGFGRGYGALAETVWWDGGLTLLTFILLVGLAEDLFFIGFVQKALTPQLGWGAIIVYLFLFVGYHFANVISGVETKKEFLGALPVRLLVSVLLSISFYLTNSLVYGLIVHNLIDTLSYIALLLAVAQTKKGTTSTSA